MALKAPAGKSLYRQHRADALVKPQRPRSLLPCRAYQPSQASNALQQSQQRAPASSAAAGQYAVPQQDAHEAERHHIDPNDYDMNYWHYQPAWLQPPVIIGTGIGFMAASLILDDEPTLKTAILAAGPVALYWGIFLYLLPRNFRSFAVDYMETHPEAEQQQDEQQQQQQEQ